MIRSKLKRKLDKDDGASSCKSSRETDGRSSTLFGTKAVWQRFYDLECQLNVQLDGLKCPANITHIYNPLQYADEMHSCYLQKYLTGPKSLVFVGMNPGPNGMCQTGVPFGNVSTVRDVMELSGLVGQPGILHVKRPITGLECKIDEPSGVRLWRLFERLANNSLEVFSQQCFVHNFCPLAFFDRDGKNITPSELKGDYKKSIRDICLSSLEQQLDIVQPKIVVAVGEYVHSCLKTIKFAKEVRILKLPHPSPRSVNNNNWPEKAEQMLRDWDLIPFFENHLSD